MTFFENVLGLKVLRHEEFDEGCEATCNGPYGGEQTDSRLDFISSAIMTETYRSFMFLQLATAG